MKSGYGFWTLVSLVVSSMIGTGIFISFSFQAAFVQNQPTILALWIVGGLIALTGALSYSDVSRLVPRSGGEYAFLDKLLHPSFGFSAGFISVFAGFAGPLAIASITLGEYALKSNVFSGMQFEAMSLGVFVLGPAQCIGVVVLLALSACHSISLRIGGNVQKILTTVKLGILGFILIGAFAKGGEPINLTLDSVFWDKTLDIGFAEQLVWVWLAYSGWNAAVYVASEIPDARRLIPRALVIGASVVAILYVLLTLAFMRSIPSEAFVAGDDLELTVIYESGKHLFGPSMASNLSLLVSISLLATLSGMVIIGPRVLKVMGEDNRMLQYFAKTDDKSQLPLRAVWIQTGIACLLILLPIQHLIMSVGSSLSIMATLTVLSYVEYSFRHPTVKRSIFFPWIHILFILLNVGMLILIVRQQGMQASLIMLLVSLYLYARLNRNNDLTAKQA
ncbi:MAG: amino acid permease [Bacteroidota bacterium]|nr:amino acid permease [Bacteroidota bacterium]